MAAERMTATEWAEQGDPRALLEFAELRICHRHLCLVQVELAERAWSASRHAMAYAPALVDEADRLAGLVRQWCFFRVSDELLRGATRALDAARPLVTELLPRAGGPNVFGLLAIVRAAAFACGVELPERPEAVPRGVPIFAPVLAAMRALHLQGPEGNVAARLAGLVRRRIPYPATENREWVAFPGIVFAGEFVLRIDGTRIGDVVPREAFASLAGSRAVAFDEAQENAKAESAAQAQHRERAAPRLAARLAALEVEATRQRREAQALAEAEAARRRAVEVAEAPRRREAARRAAIARAEAEVRVEGAAHAAELEASEAARRVGRWSSVSAWLESTSLGEFNWALALALSLSLGFAACVGSCRTAAASAHGLGRQSASTSRGGGR